MNNKLEVIDIDHGWSMMKTISFSVLKAARRMSLNHQKQKLQKMHGKTSVKKLAGEGVGVSSIEVTEGNIKSFERVARKYNIDFSVKKDKTCEPPKYLVFFKGRDADDLAQAFKEFAEMEFIAAE